MLFAASVLTLPATRRRYGSWTLGLMLALTALTALSIAWSVAPDASWRDASRMLAYSAVLAGSIAAVRMFAVRWAAVLGGITLAAALVCAYGLATKVFPSGLPANAPARLQEPFGYWNALGLTAAMGVIGCMWLGARRRGHALLSAMAYPACGVLLLTLLLAYSRGALAALAVGAVLWLAIVPAAPARRRGAAGGDARRGRGGGLGLLTARPQRRKHPARAARGRRPRAGRAGAGDGARARARGDGG